MAIASQTSHDRIVRSLADDYSARGYDVSENPLPEQMPDFLRGFHPDLIVSSPAENIVFEVRLSERPRPTDYWHDLKKAIEGRPGWRAELVVNARRESQAGNNDRQLLNGQDAKERIQASEKLALSGLFDSALMILWTVIESALWNGTKREGISVQNQGAAALISAMYSKGSLEREDYESLMRLLPARNLAAHGFKEADIDGPTYKNALELATSLSKRYLKVNN